MPDQPHQQQIFTIVFGMTFDISTDQLLNLEAKDQRAGSVN